MPKRDNDGNRQKEIDAMAITVANCLRGTGAIRQPDGSIPVYLTVAELAEICGFYYRDFPDIKTAMLRNGDHIAYTSNRGHYLGWPGEEIRNVIRMAHMSEGYFRRTQLYLQALPPDQGERETYANENEIDYDAMIRRYS